MARSSSIRGPRLPDPFTELLATSSQLGWARTAALFAVFAILLIVSHASLLRLPYFWDEAGYYVPAARDLLAGSLIPYSTPSNAHPPLVMAWLALCWKICGQSPIVTRGAMLLLAAFSLIGFFRLAKTVSNSIVATASTFLTAIYPVFFAQSSLAQVDLPAAGFCFWGLETYVRRRSAATAIWFSLAALAKETAILVPLALLGWEAALLIFHRQKVGLIKLGTIRSVNDHEPQRTRRNPKENIEQLLVLLLPVLPLTLWFGYHYARTGFVFGNPEFFRYNVQSNLHALRIFLALLLRVWQSIGYLNLYALTLACILAMSYPAQPATPAAKNNNSDPRSRIAIPIQLSFLAIAVVYIAALSILGGAALARYMLPVVPLFILVCVSTIWRRLRAWQAVLVVVAVTFVAALFVNPPYGFSPEDNLAYRDYIRLHQGAEAFIQLRYPRARVLTAWPASDELSRPNLGYTARPMQVVRIEDFTAENLLGAADERARFDVAFVFSTKYQPAPTLFAHWKLWQEWKTRYFGYHVDLSPEAAASVLPGKLVYLQRQKGQWVGVIEMETIEEARLTDSPRSASPSTYTASKWHE